MVSLSYAQVVQFFHLLPLIFLCSFIVFSHLAWAQTFSKTTADNSLTDDLLFTSIFQFDLFVIFCIRFILNCRSISSPSVESSCMICKNYRLCPLNKGENPCPKIFSTLSNSELHASIDTPLFQWNASDSETSLLQSSTLYLSKTSSSIFPANIPSNIVRSFLGSNSPHPHSSVK